MDRRTFSKAVGTGILGIFFGGILSGCTSYNVSQVLPDTLEDKRRKQEKDKSSMSDEPMVSLKLIASDSFRLVLPALLDLYQREHANVAVETPDFADANEIADMLSEGAYDGVFVDLNAAMASAIDRGLVDADRRTFFYSGRLSIVGSPDMESGITGLEEVLDPSVERVVVGNVDTVFSGVHANQAFNRVGLYGTDSGLGGTYAEALSEKLVFASTSEELAEMVATGEKTIGLITSAEALVFGLDPLHEILRNEYRKILYQAAPLRGSNSVMIAQDFITFCSTETEAEKIGDMFGMPRE